MRGWRVAQSVREEKRVHRALHGKPFRLFPIVLSLHSRQKHSHTHRSFRLFPVPSMCWDANLNCAHIVFLFFYVRAQTSSPCLFIAFIYSFFVFALPYMPVVCIGPDAMKTAFVATETSSLDENVFRRDRTFAPCFAQ